MNQSKDRNLNSKGEIKHTTTYLFSDIGYYLLPSEIIDYQLGKYQSRSLSLSQAFDNLELISTPVESVFRVFAELFEESNMMKDGQANQCLQKQQIQRVKINESGVRRVLQKDGLLITINAIKNFVRDGGVRNKDSVGLQQEIILKGLINIVYVLAFHIWHGQTRQSDKGLQIDDLYRLLKGKSEYKVETDMDGLLMKMIGMSLQVHYIPMRKLTMLYTMVLAILFNPLNLSSHSWQQHLYSDNILKQFPAQNQLPQNYLTINAKLLSQKRSNPVEHFYKRHNVGECPLAQYVVVGMLRSLLTICNCHMHKKLIVDQQRGTGVDAFREWQISYAYVFQKYQQLSNKLSLSSIRKLDSYREFNEMANEKNNEKNNFQKGDKYNNMFMQFYSHKIYSTSAITCFFLFLMAHFKRNCKYEDYSLVFIQYSYFLQLISDANGILVFLKFLTDKFQGLDGDYPRSCRMLTQQPQSMHQTQQQSLIFFQQSMLTIYSVLIMLHTACNNYPQKVKNYLFQYNSYVLQYLQSQLIIKKIPRLFIPQSGGKEEDKGLGQGQDLRMSGRSLDEGVGVLPRRDQLPVGQEDGVLPELTELCYDLLKIQIPFFSKKATKQNSNNMRMVIDIYCRYPKKVEPIQRTSFDKILLKNKIISKELKYLSSVQDLKNVHNQFNNLYYWGNDFLEDNQEEYGQDRQRFNNNRLAKVPKIGLDRGQDEVVDYKIDAEKWLQENVWRYYD